MGNIFKAAFVFKGIFATFPNPKLSTFGIIFDQIVSSSLLIIIVLASADPRNMQLSFGSLSIVMGLVVFLFGSTFVYNTGCNVNPVRDFGPRLFMCIAGWGSQVFTANSYFFWIPVVAPMFGSVLGTLLYLLLISNHL